MLTVRDRTARVEDLHLEADHREDQVPAGIRREDSRDEGLPDVTRKEAFRVEDPLGVNRKADIREESPRDVHKIQDSVAEDQPQETVKADLHAEAPKADGLTGNRSLANAPVPKDFQKKTEKKADPRNWFSKMQDDLQKASC